MAENDEKLNDIIAIQPVELPAAPLVVVPPPAVAIALPEDVSPDDVRRARAWAASAGVFHRYVDSYTAARSKQTMLESLGRAAKALGGTAETIPWAALTVEHVDNIRGHLLKKHRPATVSVTLCALKGVLKQAWREGHLTHDELARLTDWRRPRSRRLPAGRALSEAEINALIAYAARTAGFRGGFLRAAYAILIAGGLRASEFCDAETTSYDVTAAELRIIGKGDKERVVPLEDSAAEALREWLEVRKHLVRTRQLETSEPWLVVHVGRKNDVRGKETVKRLEHLCTGIGLEVSIKRFTPHDCRRTYATRLLEAGVDLATVQRLMGHDSPATTAKYDRRQAAADAVARRRVKLW